MKDEDKTKERLIDELSALRQKGIELEEILQENEKRLKDTEAMGRLGYWAFDVDAQEISWSDQVFEIYERDPSMGAPTAEEEALYYSLEEAEKLRGYARRAIEYGEELRYGFQVKLPSGKTAYMTGVMRSKQNEYGRIVKLFGIFQDITQHKQIEEALREQRDRAQKYLDVAGVILVVIDADRLVCSEKDRGYFGWGEALLSTSQYRR